MKERPILFSAPMVRAILDGTKTQTRRVVKQNDSGRAKFGGRNWHLSDSDTIKACPYGQPGDRLWVREAFAKTVCLGREMFVYREADNTTDYGGPWKPSIHMPREASRILLEITGVRVERLQDISDADAIAEGIERNSKYPTLWKRGNLHGDQNTVKATGFPKLAYRSIWEQINGHESWSANPWVWVVEFKLVPA